MAPTCLSCDVDPKDKGHTCIMNFLINTPPPKPNTPPKQDVTTFSGAYVVSCRLKSATFL